LVSVQNLLTFW